MSYRAVVIDDQASARRGISLVLRAMPDVAIVAEFADAESALLESESLAPDIAFVDIKMPGLSGLDVIRRMAPGRTEFVLVTAYDQHAITAFELAAADYVLKPFTDERLISATRRAIDRVRSRIVTRALADLRTEDGDTGHGGGNQTPLTADAGDSRPTHRDARYVTVREGERIRLIPVADIICVKAEGNLVRLVTPTGDRTIRSSLKDLLRNLGEGRFVRVHRSHAVNIDAVREIQPWFNGDYLALMRGGEQLRISRRYKGAILRRVL